MKLEGSCHCGAVRFRVESHTPYPFMRCYCSICRKTQGGGGYAINIMAEAATLKVRGASRLTVYRARLVTPGAKRARLSPARRNFCSRCGSAMWVEDPRWPDWVYPFASAIDTPLPRPPDDVELMLDYACTWADIPSGPGHRHFREYPRESIAGWHARRGLTVP
ncbi:MAG: GFA family protein [Burkholderiales bacterium]|nr:GFA family protein [Burkholderiales bacterium]